MPWTQHRNSAFRRKLEEFKRGPLTILVWVMAVAMVAILLNRRSHRSEFVGLARGHEYEISSSTGGKIQGLLVDLCDEVNAGDIVVKLDDALLAAQIETARSAVKQLEAQLGASRRVASADNAARVSEWESRMADFEAREERYRVDALNLKVTIESDRIEEQRLGLEAERMRRLLEAKAVSQDDYDKTRLQRDQVSKRIAENVLLAAKLEKNCEDAKARHEQFQKGTAAVQDEDDVIAPLRESIHKEELELDELRVRRESLVLRAPVSGRVTQVLCQTGQAVTPGEPIMVIADTRAMQVIGYVPDGELVQLREKQVMHVSRASDPEKAAAVELVSLGSVVEQIPSRLWRDPRQPEYGRCFVLSASEPLNLAPGEKMRIRMPRQGM